MEVFINHHQIEQQLWVSLPIFAFSALYVPECRLLGGNTTADHDHDDGEEEDDENAPTTNMEGIESMGASSTPS